jgi:hypothetical protein
LVWPSRPAAGILEEEELIDNWKLIQKSGEFKKIEPLK